LTKVLKAIFFTNATVSPLSNLFAEFGPPEQFWSFPEKQESKSFLPRRRFFFIVGA